MRILWFYPSDNTNMNVWQKIHIASELISNGNAIDYFDPHIYLNKEISNFELLKQAKLNRYDLFINSMESDYFFDGTIKEISKIGTYTLLICYDNTHAPFMHKKIIGDFDLVWLTSYENFELIKKWANHVIVQPYAANPTYFRPEWSSKIDRICFIGSPYGYRKHVINKLVSNECNLDVYSDFAKDENNYNVSTNYKNFFTNVINHLKFPIGRKVLLSKIKTKIIRENGLEINPFLNLKNPLKFCELSKYYSNYQLSLNVIELRNTGFLKKPILKLHLRTFEIPMSGGLMFIKKADELLEYFDDESEIVTFESEDEMINKAKYYLNSATDKEILQMKRKARERALGEHTWTHRFDNIFKLIG